MKRIYEMGNFDLTLIVKGMYSVSVSVSWLRIIVSIHFNHSTTGTGVPIPVHKPFLTMWSSFFLGMFESKMKESVAGPKLEHHSDLSPEIFK
jgi:hypothetical protein